MAMPQATLEQMFILPADLLVLHEARLKALHAPRQEEALKALAALNPTDAQSVHATALALRPWKKGPFEFLDTRIDAEWDCRRKWQRLEKHLPDLSDKLVLDVGCGNGWYMNQLRQAGAQQVVGFDPGQMNYLQWTFTQKIKPDPAQALYLLGVEELPALKKTFDVIFHMGVLYHHRDPVMQLIDLRESLAPGGTLFLETIGVPGAQTTLYFPSDRYAGMPNVWFLPTLNALTTMLARARFTDIKVLSTHWDGVEEQRPTDWGPGPSYAGALDPSDARKTIEGHPAPERFLVSARSKGLQ